MTQKFLFKPLKDFRIFQGFYQNGACIDLATNKKVIACDGFNPPAGYKSIYKTGHGGLDLFASHNTPIYSSQDGTVEEWVAEKERGIGLGIITDRKFYCDETGKEEYFKIRYWHQHINLVNLGDKVKIGQVIALADNTGYSSGSHLHYELKPVKVTFNKDGSIKKTVNILQDNGYYGAINPQPYMLDEFASEFTNLNTWKERLIYVLLKWLK
jgi:murein DD-endopeptidase MepM/ murein hydrolase activator NlpD